MSKEVIRIRNGDDEWIAGHENSQLVLFAGEMAVHNHIYVDSPSADETRDILLLRRDVDHYQDIKKVMIDKKFPLMLNQERLPDYLTQNSIRSKWRKGTPTEGYAEPDPMPFVAEAKPPKGQLEKAFDTLATFEDTTAYTHDEILVEVLNLYEQFKLRRK